VFQKKFDLGFKFSSLGLVLLVMTAGHFGGSLTHGSDYLMTAFNGPDEKAKPIKPIPDIQQSLVYKDVVEPMLQARCYSCHGKQKQKAKLRLDSPEFIKLGSKNGDVIVPGNSEESEFIKRLLLPKSDEDHMPPKEKPQLSKNQVALLQWWVQTGCSFDKKVNEFNQSETDKTMLTALQTTQPAEVKAAVIIPENPVAAADAKALEVLKERGIVIMPVAQNSNYLMASFITATDVRDDELKLLLPLKRQLLVLKLGDTKIGDVGLSIIAQCEQLFSLQLNNTVITDKGLPTLKSLTNLRSLSLVGTAVSLEGLGQLQPLKKLEHLYLYHTKVNASEYNLLKKIFAKAEIDTGGYTLKTIPSDTVVITKPITP
jgi:hypothetical protein